MALFSERNQWASEQIILSSREQIILTDALFSIDGRMLVATRRPSEDGGHDRGTIDVIALGPSGDVSTLTEDPGSTTNVTARIV